MFQTAAVGVLEPLLESPNGSTTLLLSDGLLKLELPGAVNPPGRFLDPSADFRKSISSGPVKLTRMRANRLVKGLEHTAGSNVGEDIWPRD